MEQNPIEIVGLRKEYGDFTAVDDLTLSIKKNSFTGLLGPNGAGKSTTLKILTHLINATSGEAYLNGVDVTKDPKKALSSVGTVVETPEFYLYLTPRETFRYIGEIVGMKSEAISAQTEEILQLMNMEQWADKKLGTFSKGMRQRIALGQALLNDPSIIILDEPTSGLDPRGMAETREILKNLRNHSSNLTIVMSSHILHEVSDLCDRVAMINHGKLLIHDSVEKVMESTGSRRLIVKLQEIPNETILNKIASMDNVITSTRFGNDINIGFGGDHADMSKLYKELCSLNVGVYSLYEEDSLESSYLELIKESN